ADRNGRGRGTATEGFPATVAGNPSYLVGVPGFEPRTSSSRTKRAARLRYTPLAIQFSTLVRPSASRTQRANQAALHPECGSIIAAAGTVEQRQARRSSSV